MLALVKQTAHPALPELAVFFLQDLLKGFLACQYGNQIGGRIIPHMVFDDPAHMNWQPFKLDG